MNLDICMASDDNYAVHLGICILSIVENNDCNNVNMHILDNNISKNNLNKLISLENKYSNLKIHFYNINEYFKNNYVDDLIKIELKNNDFYNLLGISAFSRLFLGDILSDNIEKILYLDADTIVLSNLEELFEIDLEDCYVAGVVDIMSNITKKFYKTGEIKSPFINSGVLLINLDKWRKIDFATLSINLINEYPDKNYLHDQNIINIICAENKLLLDPKFNVMSEFFYVDYSKNLKINSNFGSIKNFYPVGDVYNALKNPVIVHFLSQVWDRPWISQIGIFKHSSKNPYNDSYNFYKSMSPWRCIPLQENNKKFHEKLYYEFIRFIMVYLPSSILTIMFYIKNR